MFKAFLVKYAEIGIKGKNRYLFEDALIRQMEYVLKPVEGTFHVTKEQGRIYVLTEGDFDYEEALEALKRVFGIAYICPVVIKEDQGYEQLEKDVVAYVDHVYPDKEDLSWNIYGTECRSWRSDSGRFSGDESGCP